MTLATPARISRTWVWTLGIVLLLALRLPAMARPVGGDQGLYTYIAQRVLDHGVPYRDAFEQKPPGIFFVYGASWLLWPRVSVAAFADLVASGLCAFLLIQIGRRLFGGRVGEAAAVLYLLLGDPGIQRLGGMNVRGQCEVFIGVAIAGAVLIALGAGSRPGRWFVAGLCVGFAVWLKYNAMVYGLPVALAAAATGPERFDWRRFIRAAAWVTGGMAFTSGAFLLYFALAGGLTDLWIDTILYNLRYSGETYASALAAVGYLFTMPIERGHVAALWYLGLLGSALLVLLRAPRRVMLLVIAWIGVAVISIALNGHRGLPQYFLQALPALALAGAGGLAFAWRHRHQRRMPAAIAALGLIAGLWRVGDEGSWTTPRLFGVPEAASNLAFDLRYFRGEIARDEYLARFDRGDGGKLSPDSVERLASRIAKTPAADTSLVFGFSAGSVLSRAERVSASRFFWSRVVVMEFAADKPGYGSAAFLAELQRNRPAVVALQKHDWGLAETIPDSIDFFLNHPQLRAWLDATYVPDYEDDAYAVWRRKN
ncbi:MAG TPA: glycosyltransferase family 39 protein [Vicinamibacterales bacterium]|nr:glycosyltransferase family 39 protein [Vicinamibacterales bacterium]